MYMVSLLSGDVYFCYCVSTFNKEEAALRLLPLTREAAVTRRPPPPGRRSRRFRTGSEQSVASELDETSETSLGRPAAWDDVVVLRRRGWEFFVREWTP